jgi:hypothetical protein
MNRVEMRDLLVAHMDDNWSHGSTVPVFYLRQHATIDLDQLATPSIVGFIKFSVVFENAEQMSLGESPEHRLHGTLEIMLFVKEGSSERESQGFFDELTELFKFKALGRGLHTKTPTPGRSEEHDGWCSQTLRVPFFADSYT